MFKDENEKVRRFVNVQYVKMKRVAAVGSLILLTINLSFLVYPYIEFRVPEFILGMPRMYLILPIIFIIIVFIVWLGAHIYTETMEMYRTESRANIMYNPYQVYAFQPFWEMWWRDVYVPQMRTQLTVLKNLHKNEANEEEKKYLEKDIKYMKSEVDKIKNWLELGFIPKKDFPEHLKKFYKTNKEIRL